MEYYKIKTNFTCDTIHDILVWLGTGSIPADINRFQSHTEKSLVGI